MNSKGYSDPETASKDNWVTRNSNWLKQILWLVIPGLTFLIAVAMAVYGTFNYSLNRSNAWWLSAGWIFASLAIFATLLWANQVGVQESRDNRKIKKSWLKAANLQQRTAEHTVSRSLIAQREVDEALKGDDKDFLANKQTVLAQLNAEAVEASSRAANLWEKANSIPILFTPNSIPATFVATMITFIFSGLVVVTFWTAVSAKGWAASIVWCGALLIVGGLAGFLFGIPRSGAQKAVAAQAQVKSPNQQPQSNPAQNLAGGVPTTAQAAPVISQNQESPIEQMADWLTKAIVGVALVNLRQIRDLLLSLSHYIAQSIAYGYPDKLNGISQPITSPDASSCSFALGMILYFSMVGFLCGYLLTQMFLMNYVNRKP